VSGARTVKQNTTNQTKHKTEVERNLRWNTIVPPPDTLACAIFNASIVEIPPYLQWSPVNFLGDLLASDRKSCDVSVFALVREFYFSGFGSLLLCCDFSPRSHTNMS
jgi:hypothetical protein